MPSKMLLSKIGFCEEKLRLVEDFLSAATDLVTAHSEQVKAVTEDDPDFNRFDLLIHIDRTRALRPLDQSAGWDEGEPPETWPDAL